MSHKQKKRGKKHNTKATTADPRPQPGWPNQLSHPAQAGSTIQHSQQDQHALHLQMQQNQQFQQAQQAEQIHQQQQQAPQYHNMQPMPPNQSGPVPQNLQAQHHMLGPHNEQNPQLAHQNLQYPQMQNMPQNAQAMQNQLAQRNEQIRHQEQMQINQQYQQNQLNRQAENANMQVAHVNPEVQGGHLRPHGPHPYPGLPPQYPGRPSGHPNARPYTYNGSAHSVPPSFQPGNVQSPPVPSLAHPQYVQENADYFNNNPDVPHPPIGFSPYEGLADSPYVLSPRGPQSASAFLVGNTQSPMFQPTQSPYGYNVTSPAVNGQPQQLVHNQDHSGFPQPQNVGNPQFPHPGQFNCPPGQMAPPSHYRQSSNHPPNHHGHISRAPRMPRPTNYPNVPEAFQGMFENSNFLSRSSSQNPQAVRIVPRDRTQPNRPMPDYPAPTQNQMSQQYPQESVPNPGQYSSDFANPSYMGPPRMESGQPHQTRGKRNSTGPLDINEISGNHQPPSSLVNGNPAPSHYKSQPNSGNSCRNFQELQQSLLSGDEEMIVDSTPPTRSSSKNPPEKNKSNSGTLVDKSCVMESQQSSVSQPIQVALANNTTDPWAVEDASKGANHTESAKKTLEKGAVCAKIVDKLLEGKAESFKTAKKEAEKNMEVNNQLQISPEYVPFAGGIDDLLGSRPSSRDNSGEPTNCMNLDVSAVYDEVLEEPAPEEILSSPFPKTEPENKKQSDEKIISQIVAVNSQNVVSVSAEHVQDSQVDEQSHSVSHPTQKKGMIAKSSQSTGIAVNPDPQLDISRTRPLSHNPEHSVDGIDDQRGQADKIITSILKRKKEEDCLLVIKKQKSAGESAKVSHPQIDVAPGRIPPINVAPGSTTQINVAPGRIPPINVAPGSTPEINVAPGPNPPINVAPGSTPEINVAPGRIPPINVAPGPTPQINVAPGPNPPINVAPGRIPPINVAPDQNPQINVVPGPNPSINVAPGPSPSINVAPGRNPQINVAPGRIPRVKINVAPGPIPQINVAPGQNPPINVAPGPSPSINVAPGRNPQINVAPGRIPRVKINVAPGPIPQINVAPGPNPPINVAPGRIPPINVAPGPTPQINVAPGPNPPINVAPGRIPPINVAPDQNPQINVVPGPNPSINVAPGPSPSINVAPGRNPQINVAPGRIPRVKINVAPGPPSQINVVPERNPQINVDHGRDAQANVAPGRNPQINVDHGRDPQANVAPGRNPQINVDHGRDPQANVAPGRNPQINIAPGRCPRIKINVAPAPTSQINDAPVRTPQANVAHCRNPRVKATRKRAPVSKKKITRPKDSDDSSTDDTDDTRSSRSKRDSSHLSDHQDETKRVSHKKTAGPAPKRAANPPANALAGEENQAVQVEEEPRRHGLLLDPESEEIIEFVNNSRFKYLFEMTEEEFVKQFVNFPKKKRRHTRQMSVANYDFYMHIKEAKRPSFDKLIPLACTNLENKIGTEKEITEFILGHYIFSIPVLKVVQFIERDFRHLIFLTQLLPHTDLLGIRRYSYCGYGNVDTLSVKLPIQPESTPELVEKIKKFFKSLGYDTIIDDKIIFIRRTTKKLGSDKKGRRRHLSLYFEEEMLREALVEFKDCKTKGIKRLTLESAETILCSTGPDASYDHLIHEAIASRRSQRATEDQIAMYGLSHYNLDIPVKDVCDKISECLAKMSETGILSKTVSERGKVVYAEIPVEHVDTGRLVTSGDLKKTASEEHMNLARNTIKLLDPNGEGINSEDVANYIYEHNDFENVSQFEHILWRCLKKMERGGELSLTQTKEYQVNENKNETFVNTNVVVKWLK